MSLRLDLILRQLDALPPLPAVAVKVLELTGKEKVETRELVSLIEADPAVAGRVLQLVRRSDAGVSGGGRGVTSIERAVVLLGFRAIRSAVLSMGVLHALPARQDDGAADGGGASSADFWTHSLAVGCAAEQLAERLAVRHGRRVGSASDNADRRLPTAERPVDPAEAFCCGLLHDLGKLALQSALPKSYGRIIRAADVLRGNIADIEQQVIGLDHATAGRRLADRWQLPPVIRDVIWLHNQHPDALPEQAQANIPMILLVTLADQIARGQHLGYSGNHSFGIARPSLLVPLGLSADDVTAVESQLFDRLAPRAAALGLEDGDAATLFRRALERAGQDLARTNQRLADQRQSLRSRARCFATMAQFRQELRPEASVGDVLLAIGQTAGTVLGASPTIIFSLAAHREEADVLLIDGERVVQQGVVLLPADETGARPGDDADGDGPVRPAGDGLERILADFGPRLQGGRRWWMRLDGDGQTIGGILWGGDAEHDRLSGEVEELRALCAGWSMALHAAQVREGAQDLAEQLAEANRRLVEAQERIARDRAVTAVAELAAGAAHELNNPLMVISGRSQLLYHTLRDDRQKKAALAIHQNAQRLSDMVTGLMRFARPDRARTHPTVVEDLVDATLRLLADLPERMNRGLEVNLPPLPPAQVDHVQIARALAAILENAFQATVEQVGRVEIHAACDFRGENLVITVLDNGIGMDEHTLRHAADPFFSKKDAGRRRGMGLAVASRLIEANAGTLRLDSREGVGTRVVITLPVAKPVPATDDLPLRPRKTA